MQLRPSTAVHSDSERLWIVGKSETRCHRLIFLKINDSLWFRGVSSFQTLQPRCFFVRASYPKWSWPRGTLVGSSRGEGLSLLGVKEGAEAKRASRWVGSVAKWLYCRLRAIHRLQVHVSFYLSWCIIWIPWQPLYNSILWQKAWAEWRWHVLYTRSYIGQSPRNLSFTLPSIQIWSHDS